MALNLALGDHGSVNAKIKKRYWEIRQSTKKAINLQHHTPKVGWYQLTITYHTDSDSQIGNTVLVELGPDHAPIPLGCETPGKLELVFHSPTPLHYLTLVWPALQAHIQATINIKRVSQPRAMMHMLRTISRRDRQNGGNWQQIYRITRARQKRAGWSFARERLIQTYHPMFIGKTLFQAPYTFWQQHFQPSLPEPQSVKDIAIVMWMDIADSLSVNEKSAITFSIQSLLEQTHQQWQLNLLTQTPPAWLTDHLDALNDERIQIISSHCAPYSTKAWHGFVTPGDQWAPNALTFFAQCIEQNPNARLVYSDHDQITDKQQRDAPAFKPQWSPDLLKSYNYIGRAVLFSGNITTSAYINMPQHVRCLNAGISAPATEKSCIHIPHILFHQHSPHQEDISFNERQQVLQALKQLTQHHTHGIKRVTFDKMHQVYHCHYRLPTPYPRVSIVIPTRNGLAITRQCVESILRLTSYPHYQIIIVNNQSDCPDTLAWFQRIGQQSNIEILEYNQPFNFSAINNFAVSHSDGDLVCLLNNDTEVIHSNWLTEMVRQASRPEIGCVGAKLLFFDDTIQHAGVILGIWGLAGHAHKHYSVYSRGYQRRLACSQNYSAVTAACLLVKRAIYDAVGGLDEKLTVAFNDVDFCLKVQQAGYTNLWTPRATLYHYESKSRGKEDTPAKKAREQQEITLMKQRWQTVIQNDPHYSRHLTRHREDFTLRLEEDHFEEETET
ncbi:hypothetical protein BGL48_14085 [Salinivibrio sp. SS3]|nr:hypothetical protein BGL48_14085 [Salinivibrio sp. BNH]